MREATVAPVAVIGMACRLPGGVDSPQRLWEALLRGDDFVGREKVFELAGFRCVSRPDPSRAIMRLDLGGRGS